MTRLILHGIDPGIKDTALTTIELDFGSKEITIFSQIWAKVLSRKNNSIDIEEKFLDELSDSVRSLQGTATFTGIEGYRARGLNLHQDQAMQHIVQTLNHRFKGSIIVENTGIKQVVTRPLLQLFHVARFKDGGNHNDRVSAARVALRLGIQIESLNTLLSDYVEDHLYKEEPWALKSTVIR